MNLTQIYKVFIKLIQQLPITMAILEGWKNKLSKNFNGLPILWCCIGCKLRPQILQDVLSGARYFVQQTIPALLLNSLLFVCIQAAVVKRHSYKATSSRIQSTGELFSFEYFSVVSRLNFHDFPPHQLSSLPNICLNVTRVFLINRVNTLINQCYNFFYLTSF